MKILQINSVCKSSSTGKIAYDLHAYLEKSGNESVIAYGRGAVLDDKDMWRFSPVWEVYAHGALTRITGRTGCFSPVATSRLLKYIDEYAPDIVHLHNIHGYYVSVYGLLSYLKKKPIPTVITLHDEWIYTGKCGYTYDCDKWQGECGKCPRVGDYPSSIFFDCTRAMHRKKKSLLTDFDRLTIVTPSQWLTDKTKQSFLRDKRIFTIAHGIDIDTFHPYDNKALKTKYPSEKSVVHVTAGFENKRKGGQYVLELARRMPDISFYIVGNNKPVVNLPKNVIAIGYVQNQQQLAEWFSFADVFLITSDMDNLPVVCLESVCCGTPVVGFASGGTAETAPDGYGLFVPYPDVEALEVVTRRALNGELRSKKDCAEFGEANYAKTTMAQRYLEIYQEVAEK